ncbi:hypothetical protein F5884DRAFT_742412 [Xylogone sp. PMI_703]|nr:hypothetical protein F5884DRAFT_742412 [Xylogone sp. PMI_703]
MSSTVTSTVTSTSPSSKDITTAFTYLKWQDCYKTDGVLEIVAKEDPRKTNMVFHKGPPEIIHDVRGYEPEYKLDTHGFQFEKHTTALTPEEFKDRAIVNSRYYPESIALYKERLEGVDEVFILTYENQTSAEPVGRLSEDGDKEAHVDQSAIEIEKRIHRVFPDRADFLLRGRIRVINLWRPLQGPVQNYPMIVSDGRSISQDCLVEFDRVQSHRTNRARLVMHDPNAKWYYMSDQQRDDVLFVKCYDTDTNNPVTKGCPHASLKLPTATPDTPYRESCEIRAYVFTYPIED